MAEETRIDGLREIGKKLNGLGKKLRNRTAGKALRAGASIVRNDARAKAPFRDGFIRKNIVMRTSTGRRAGRNADVVVRVGVRKIENPKPPKQPKRSNLNRKYLMYWIAMEFGTSRMPARPFLRPAFEENQNRALNVIIDKFRQGVKDAVR